MHQSVPTKSSHSRLANSLLSYLSLYLALSVSPFYSSGPLSFVFHSYTPCCRVLLSYPPDQGMIVTQLSQNKGSVSCLH